MSVRDLAPGRYSRTSVSDVGDLPPAPHPDPATWGGPLLEALATEVGAPVAWAAPPEVLDHPFGPWAFGCELAPAVGAPDLAARWRGPLVVRLCSAAEGRREAAAQAACRAVGLGAPEPLALVGVGGDLLAQVSTRPTLTPLPDLIGYNLTRSDELLSGFAAHHVAVHDRAAGGLADVDSDAVPVVTAAGELARIDAARYERHHRWLAEHAPEPGPAVLCHGGYQPLCVYGPGPEGWDAVGGPGKGLVVGNWVGAVLADREFDVAFTLVAFWSAPFFAPTRSERTAIKMIRNTLSNSYRLAYQAVHPDLDADRVRWWQVFHALRGLARMEGAYDATGSPFAAGDRGPVPAALAPELDRHVRQLVRV